MTIMYTNTIDITNRANHYFHRGPIKVLVIGYREAMIKHQLMSISRYPSESQLPAIIFINLIYRRFNINYRRYRARTNINKSEQYVMY